MNNIDVATPSGPIRIMRGMAAETLSSGVRYLAMHYSADDEKTSEWALRASQGVPRRDWDSQMELHDHIYDGEPVFADYNERKHCPPVMLQNSWVPTPRSAKYVLGIDAGATLWPAAVLMEIGPAPWYQVVAMREWTCLDGNEPMQIFCPRVLKDLTKFYPAFWDDIEWRADETVGQRSGTNGQTAIDIARTFGVKLIRASNKLHGEFGRMSAVSWALTNWIEDDIPRYFICGKDCPMLLEGFRGAYRFREQKGDGFGRDLKEPMKDVYSHVQDANGYGLLHAKEFIAGGSGGKLIRRGMR